MTDTDLALRDPLTGALNRRFLTQLFSERWAELRAEHGPVAVVLIDLDRFKEVNDRHGHLMGDGFLKATAARLGELVRRSDHVIRYGGDEFVVVLPGMGEPEAVRLMEAIRGSAAERRLTIETGGARIERAVSFSFGVGSAPGDGLAGEDALAAADRRLYDDKRRRRREAGLRRAVPRAAVLALAVGATVALGFGLVSARRATRLDTEVVPAPAVSPLALLPLAPPPDEAASASALEEALHAQIVELKRQIDALRKEVAKEAAPPTREPAELDLLRDTVEQLEQQLEGSRPPRTAPAAEPAVASPTPPHAVSQAPPRVTPHGAATATPEGGTAPEVAADAGMSVVPPVLSRFVKPRYPRTARELRKEATVVVRVTVDREGRVLSAVTEGGPYGFGFEEAAVGAARSARYRPGTIDGEPAEMDSTLYFRFQVDGRG